ncbi:hypothetical protein PVAG01_06805 [Phlyctema vagabunda]|uniref:Uncharacterized protein n=1 Tax=Phlyctema vagabunda TaxID=108571 RepID=A0ABR4PH59_9HELO
MSSPDPDSIVERWQGMRGDLQTTIRETFQLPEEDEYVYAAEAFQKTLAQVQQEMATGKYRWNYRSADHQIIPVSEADITAYTSNFAATTDTAKSLKSFAANAKKGSPRAMIASYLETRRLTTPDLRVSRSKNKISAPKNPYLDVWAWSCHETGFVGPLDDAGYAHPDRAKLTHPMLPVLYHHFGCVCPTFESLELIALLCRRYGKKGVLDMASGSGYWTYLLRRHRTATGPGQSDAIDTLAVDNMEAQWRYTWIRDTIQANGVTYLKTHGGARDRVLLLVYMITRGDFTRRVLEAYAGDVIVIAGTQNANRFTGFEGSTVEQYFAAHMPAWQLVVRVALPSFAGKDEGLFVYTRGEGTGA